jgi:hypothetical protein
MSQENLEAALEAVEAVEQRSPPTREDLAPSATGLVAARGDPPHGRLASVARHSHGGVAGVLADVLVEAAEVTFVARSEGSEDPNPVWVVG